MISLPKIMNSPTAPKNHNPKPSLTARAKDFIAKYGTYIVYGIAAITTAGVLDHSLLKGKVRLAIGNQFSKLYSLFATSPNVAPKKSSELLRITYDPNWKNLITPETEKPKISFVGAGAAVLASLSYTNKTRIEP